MTFKEFELFFKKNTEFNYVACDGKKRISEKTLTRNQAVSFLKDNNTFVKENKSIGLIVPSGYVVIDIDEGKEKAKRALKALNIKTLVVETPKGLHLFFHTNKKLNRKIGVLTPIGLKCDQLSASTSYVILPPNNKNRKLYMKHKVAKLPKEFTPLINQKDSLLDLCDGDGRNDRLLSVLASYKKKFGTSVTDDDLFLLGSFINSTIFEDPLKTKEIDYIVKSIDSYAEAEERTFNGSIKIKDYRETVELLDMTIDRFDGTGRNKYLSYNEKGKPVDLDHLELADLLVNAKTFCVSNKVIYRFKDGVYVECGQEVRDLIKTLAGITNVTKQSKIMEAYNSILDDIRLRVDPSEFENDPNFINFDNCVWDISRGAAIAHKPKLKFKTKIPHRIVNNSKSIYKTKLWELMEMMEMPQDDRQMLLEFMAYTLIKNNNLRAFLMFVGQAGSGKSLLISYISKVVGELNTAAVSLQDLNKRFQAASLENKMLNVCADNQTSALYQIDVIKRITGGDVLTCEYKGRDPYPFKPFAKLCFSFNQMPLQLEEKSDAFYDRMRVLRIDKKLDISPEFAKLLFSEKEMTAVLSYLVRLLPLKKVTKSRNSLIEVEIARKRSDSIYDFTTNFFVKDDNICIEKEKFFDMYTQYCRKTQRTPHAYYIFFDHILDYPYIDTVTYEHKGMYIDYIKGLKPRRQKVEPPQGKPVNLHSDVEQPEINFDNLGQTLKKVEKKTPKKAKKTLIYEFDFTDVKTPLIYEFDFTNVTQPKVEKISPTVYIIDFTNVKKTLIYEFDFTKLKRGKKHGHKHRRTNKKNTHFRE